MRASIRLGELYAEVEFESTTEGASIVMRPKSIRLLLKGGYGYSSEPIQIGTLALTADPERAS